MTIKQLLIVWEKHEYCRFCPAYRLRSLDNQELKFYVCNRATNRARLRAGGIEMTSNSFSRFFATDMPSTFPGLNGFGFDFRSLMDTHRKNMEALTEAQQLAFENLRAIAVHNKEIITRIAQDNSSMAREIMSERTPEQKVARQADMMKKTYENSVSGIRELTEMINKSSLETSDVLNRRVSASLTEIRSALEKGGKAAHSGRHKAAA